MVAPVAHRWNLPLSPEVAGGGPAQGPWGAHQDVLKVAELVGRQNTILRGLRRQSVGQIQTHTRAETL